MSIKTFKEEFYPVPASKATGSDKEAAAHSKHKWEGFRPENLERHGLKRHRLVLSDWNNDEFWFGSSTCALCLRHSECIDCPVREADGECGQDGSAYQEAIDTGNPERLIQILGTITEGGEPVNTVSQGDCFFNLKRFSCLRVIHVRNDRCDAITWRPDGSRGSNRVTIRTENLFKSPYLPMDAVRVYAGGKSFEFEVSREKNA